MPADGFIELSKFAELDAAQESHCRETYRTDGPFASAAQSLYLKANAPNPKLSFKEYLSYVITSGANWAGPIGTFRLIVDKGDPKRWSRSAATASGSSADDLRDDSKKLYAPARH